MIFTDRKITIRNGKSSINEPVILYRGDYEVSIKFTIMESKFRFKSGVNLVDSEKASFGQLAILAPYGGNVFSEVVKCEDGTVTFTLTKEMIDQLEEVGLYSFQIRLFDYYRESRVSIPPVEFGIEVREPVASEDHGNKVNNAIVGYSIAKVVDGLNEDVPGTFDVNGNYNKTNWKTGDRISQGKLNKIEDALDKINQNEINDKNALNKQMSSNFNVLQNQIDNLVIESGNTDAEVEQARGEYNLLNQRLNAMDKTDVELASQLEHIEDYNTCPQGVKPSKSGNQKNSFKIIKKTKDNELIIIQQTNKGCIKYTFQRGVGASQEGRDYGINHELLRIVKAEHIQDAYVYYDISTPIDGSFTSPTLYEPSKINTVEQLVCYTSYYDEVNTFSSKTNGLGIGAYKLYYGTSVSYNIPVTMNGKCNLLFLGTSTSSQKIEIYVNDILVKEFNPRVFVMGSYNGIGLIEFDVPTKSTTNSVFKVTIKNADSTGHLYPCAINFKKLEQYNGEHITDFKCFGTTSNGWITNNGASDYALYDADKKLWFGSYHGGEILELEQISWGTQTVEENPYYTNNTTLSNITLNDWRIQKTFNIYQQTNLANNKAKMVSIFNFNNDGTLDMDFNYYDGQVNLSGFYTALTCTDVNFNYVFYPIFKNLGTTPTNTDIALPVTEGKVSQVNSSDKLQLDIRFTKFNNSKDNRGCVIADNIAYRKLYYGPIYGKTYLLGNLTFSKSLDFIVR